MYVNFLFKYQKTLVSCITNVVEITELWMWWYWLKLVGCIISFSGWGVPSDEHINDPSGII